MRVRVSDQALLHDLIQYLRQLGCIAEQAGANTLDVFLPSILNEHQARIALGGYLADWRQANSGAETQINDHASAKPTELTSVGTAQSAYASQAEWSAVRTRSSAWV
jgi:hypothetical protein